ncbi:MAG: hypothetical protein ALECFALPRED_005755 [Alectoria fallacina]|uniref:Transcription factor CBF/NF-Y/archaeal histone domain-containing protein n=1 Tax=Alectoria fallacina TaxID=1903189 RepID=A0A8H3FZI5_9LECA|nr:MAG: hypothetical protein ALECFALPRED_005755 [Alectoria fallacina]
MDDFEGSYAPQSPDLSGFQAFDDPDPFATPYYPPQQTSYQPSYLQQPLNHDPFSFDQAPPPLQQQSFPNQYQPPIMPPTNGKAKSRAKSEEEEFNPEVPAKVKGAGRKSKKQKVEEEVCAKPAPGVEEGIEVKTKFPVARIKRIMQADEDVGKVAQVTPTAVCKFAHPSPATPTQIKETQTDSFRVVAKALELFMISVVTKAAAEARAKQSKRVTAAHLKQAVMKDDQLDFLAEIISKAPDAPAPSKKEKEEDSEEGGEGKRKKKGGTKKKKKDDDEF